MTYHEAVDAFKKQLLTEAMTEAHGNVATAAKGLGLPRTYYWRLLKRHEVPYATGRPSAQRSERVEREA